MPLHLSIADNKTSFYLLFNIIKFFVDKKKAFESINLIGQGKYFY